MNLDIIRYKRATHYTLFDYEKNSRYISHMVVMHGRLY